MDFPSAFNTIYHDKLWLTMEMLGFEQQRISAIRSLYTGATTTFVLNGHETDQVHIARGTLQGDSLSPLLFIIALEPLLRWLHSGGRGYTFGSDSRLTIAANAYADDLGKFSGCPKDLAVQAQKIQHISDWAGLRSNVGKCAVTGILHNYADKDGTQNPLAPKMLTMLRNRLKGVTLDGKQPQFLHPHNDTYRYLGVELTMTLNWKFQLAATVRTLQDKGKKVNASMLTPMQKLTYIQNSLRPAITYALPVCPYDVRAVKTLDYKLIAIVKKALRLSSMPNGSLLQSRDKAGMGVTSLLIDYGQLFAAHLTRSFNDEGPLGRSTRALYVWQHQSCHGQVAMTLEQTLHGKALDKGLRDFNIIRPLSLMDALGAQLQWPAIIGQLNHSQLYHELEGYCRETYGEETELPGCLDKFFYFAQLGVNISRTSSRPDMKGLASSMHLSSRTSGP